MTKFKVVITDFISEPLTEENRILGDIATVEALNGVHEEDLIGRIEDADAVMMYHFLKLTEKVISRLTKCKLIVRCGVGFDNVDRIYARSRGIPVANVPDYGTEEVADSALGLLLSLMRGIHFLNSRLQANRGEWTYNQVGTLHRLRGQTCGVVGIGRIGTAFALRAKALGFKVLFYDPYVPEGVDKALGLNRCESLEELLQHSNVVSMHCPLTPETKHMLNARTLRYLPKGAYVVNTSRGGVVDVPAVVEALREGHLAGAGIDVLEQEPPDSNSPVLQAWRNPDDPAYDRLILNPHAAFYSHEGLLDMRIKGSENCRRVLQGKPPRNVVN